MPPVTEPSPTTLLTPLTTPSPTTTPQALTTALHHFTLQARAAAATNPPSTADYLWTAFSAVLAAAGATAPERQGALVEFVVRLQKTRVFVDGDGEGGDDDGDGDGGAEEGKEGGRKVVVTCEGAEVWRGMPTFGWVVRDGWNFGMFSPEFGLLGWLISSSTPFLFPTLFIFVSLLFFLHPTRPSSGINYPERGRNRKLLPGAAPRARAKSDRAGRELK